ncbi:receptor-type tyrosine-protein phosphatase delta-like isoform X2 [Cylas formicarius]|uniref:receptor-type tyrosine-protein phosphatase delta-like isoform X2 n=1 Tax=Cylas formicarius TaxID=197179 RepID=UPI002958B47A|nr:receptor-type tyrosine-protein phosphatase delta-like isoform X2 [Cylas formicarius]
MCISNNFIVLYFTGLTLWQYGVLSDVLLTTIGNKCITKTSSAISFNEKITDDTHSHLVNIVSDIVPKTDLKSGINCKLYKGEKCTSKYIRGVWTLQSSLDDIQGNQVITDRRWEAFPLYLTKHVDEYGKKLLYQKIVNIKNGSNFDISLSIRIQHEAHIFLCDGEQVSNSNCYWVMLHAWKGKKTALRKCGRNFIQEFYNGQQPSEPCSIIKFQKTHDLYDHYLHEDIWNHFVLSKKNDRILFTHHQGKVIIDYTDKEPNPFQISHMVVHSKSVNGLWKIHDNYHLHSKSCFENEPLGKSFKIRGSQSNCIAMFIVMCSDCQLNLKIKTTDGQILYDTTFETSDQKWKEIKMIFTTNKSTQGKIHASTNSKHSTSEDRFWSIDEFRECKEKEYRILKTESNDWKCQMVGSEYSLKSESNPKKIIISNSSNCPEYVFGQDCIPCGLINDNNDEYCQLNGYCELYSNGNRKCSCTAGYYGDGVECLACPRHTFGQNCQKSCGHCEDGCKGSSGECLSRKCLENYIGPKCDIGLFEFRHNPAVSEIYYESCLVTVQNFDGNGVRPFYYKIEYKRVDAANWYAEAETQFFHPRTWRIKNLTSDTEYELRIIAFNTQLDLDVIEKHYQIRPKLSVKFKTDCEALTNDLIKIAVSNTTAEITFNRRPESCNILNYQLSMDGQIFPLNQSKCLLESLRPFAYYTLNAKYVDNGTTDDRKKFNITFRTLEGTPGAVEDVIYSKNTVKWKKPQRENGVILYYNVDAELKKHKACLMEEKSLKTVHYATKNTSIDLVNAEPYSIYEIKISANTSVGYGAETTSVVETPERDIIELDEIPEIEIQPKLSQVILIPIERDCKKVKGSIFIHLKVNSTEKWCLKNEVSLKIDQNFAHTINDLAPYCNYSVQFWFFRESEVDSTLLYKSINVSRYFRTQASASEPIRSLMATSTTSNSVCLRWLPPYPPTGELSGYKVAWTNFRGFEEKSITIKPSRCTIWPDYHCWCIINLKKPNERYQVEVYAQNTSPKVFSPRTVISFITKESEPDPPYDLKTEWTDENDLVIKWKHPNATNGILVQFSVFVEEMVTNYMIKSEEEYQPVYEMILRNLTLPGIYEIKIRAINSQGSSIPLTGKCLSPPPMPETPITSLAIVEKFTIMINFSRKANESFGENYETFLYILISRTPDVNLRELEEFKVGLTAQKIIKLRNYKLIFNNSGRYPTELSLPISEINDNNASLIYGTDYKVAVFFVNECNGYVRIKRKIFTVNIEATQSDSALYALILPSVVATLCVFLGIRCRSQLLKRSTAIMNQFRESAANGENPPRETQALAIPIIKRKVDVAKVVRTDIPGGPTFEPTNSLRVKLSDFKDYVKTAIESGELEKQHNLFPRGQTKPWEYGILPVNKSKNRYNNLIAYDHTRVILEKNGDQFSDYINANYIDGYRFPKAYIATQGPKNATVGDFWRMVWQENVKYIIMLANILEGGKKKTEKYWPELNQEDKYGDITVMLLSSEIHANYDLRKLKIYYENEQRKIDQLHFKAWPDHGVPLYPQCLVPFLQRMLTVPYTFNSPLLVHCSAGVGRTGTVILCDICLRMAASEGFIDILGNLAHLREQRPNMVDNIEQYKLAHLLILEFLFGWKTNIPCDSGFSSAIQKFLDTDFLQKQLEYIKDTEWQNDAMKTVAETHMNIPVQKNKNRFSHIIPEGPCRVYLSPYPPSDLTSSYINAVRVDGFCQPGRFIVTQQPMPNTLGDFWRLVVQRKCNIIISLHEIDSNDNTSIPFWSNDDLRMTPVDFIRIDYVKSEDLQMYSVTKFEMLINKHDKEEKQSIELIQFNGWKNNNVVPGKIEDFVLFVGQSTAISRKSNPVIVTCYDGAKGSGLYVAMSFLIEKIKLEQEFDVCQAIRSIRNSRKQFVNSKEQLEFLYRASIVFVNGFQSYANFNL